MELRDAIDFIGPALDGAVGTWADFGAGTGTFTRALASMLGADGRVYAIDRDGGALRTLERRAAADPPGGAHITPVRADFRRPGAIAKLAAVDLDGAVFANALHFDRDPATVLARIVERLRVGGRVVVIEYDRQRGNRWVPHPIPAHRLRGIAARAGLGAPEVVSRRASAYQGELYCAVAEVPA